MEDSVKHAYKEFLQGIGGADLIRRLISTEARYQMEGMKASSLEEKGLAMAKIGATYEIRTMLNDLSNPASSQPVGSVGSKKRLTK